MPAGGGEVLTWVVEGELDVAAYWQAWRRAVARYAALRTLFRWEGLDEPLQLVRAEASFTPTVEDWRALSDDERPLRLAQYLGRERETGFTLSAEPTMRLSLLRSSDRLLQVVWSYPSLLLDRRSARLVFDEVHACYESLAAGEELRAEPARPFSEFVVWSHRQEFPRAEAHWRRALLGLDPHAATLVPARADAPTRADAEERATLAPETAGALDQLARGHGLSPESVYLGAWALLTGRYRDSRDGSGVNLCCWK